MKFLLDMAIILKYIYIKKKKKNKERQMYLVEKLFFFFFFEEVLILDRCGFLDDFLIMKNLHNLMFL